MWIEGGIVGDKVINLRFSIYNLKLKLNMKYQSIYNRIKRIEGQVRGISEMIVADKPEQDILIQLEAARSSLGSTISALIESLIANEKEGKVELTKDQLRAIMRAVKR